MNWENTLAAYTLRGVLLLAHVHDGDDEQHRDAAHEHNLARNARAAQDGGLLGGCSGGGSARQAEVVSEGGADEHADEGDGGVAGALAGQRHLAQRAAAGQRGAEAHGVQAQDVPQVLGVGDGLAIEAKLEAAGDQVEHHHDHEQAGDGEHQVEVAHKEDVADGAGEADADLLRQGADHESGHQGDEHGSVLGARAGLADGEHAGEDADAQADDQQRGQDGAGRLVRVMLAAQGVALLQEERARGNAQDESDEADPGVQVAGGHAQHHAKRAAQEDEGADHHDEAQDESGHGGRTGRGAILARGQGDQERADDQADDLGAEVLHRLGGLQLHGARHVADEARGAHGHVGGVAGEGQKRHSEADQHADRGPKPFFRC